jgi:signal transduction histidine kinase
VTASSSPAAQGRPVASGGSAAPGGSAVPGGPVAPGRLARAWEGLRPLDPVRSIKMKFALLVFFSGALTALLELYGLTELGWRPRYSLTLAVLISLGVSQVIAHGMTAPLRQMTAAARSLASGRPATAVRASSRDEVGELARAFTAMSRELASVDTQRRELLGNVGHELRTPVAALRAQLENLADGVRPADPTALAEVLDQVERLGDLVANLLDLARADGGQAALERRPVPARALVDAVVAQVTAARGGDRRVSIEVRVEPAELIVDADPHRLGQVLTNLVDNATKHARDGGRVQVAVYPDAAGGFVLEVTDDGPGIPPERWESVFERFRGGTGEIAVVPPAAPSRGLDRTASKGLDSGSASGGGSKNGLDGGTGLGLAIARWAVALHGGRIAVVPAEAGCRIRVEIPPS